MREVRQSGQGAAASVLYAVPSPKGGLIPAFSHAAPVQDQHVECEAHMGGSAVCTWALNAAAHDGGGDGSLLLVEHMYSVVLQTKGSPRSWQPQ